MQRYTLNGRNKHVEDFQVRDNLIATLKNRFTTYGYKQVRTKAFENYEMYSNITGTVKKDDMIKVIDTTGKILVLRPDVTIPITRMMAAVNQANNTFWQRLFYVMDVFRQSQEMPNQKESTQAGVEFFGENTPEEDAEIIMLAIHTLKDLGFKNFKIEIGHAGFFKELIQQAELSEQDLGQLQALIQSKNIADMELFLEGMAIEEELKKAIQSIPLLYGDPLQVIQQAEKIIRSAHMQHVLQNLIDVFALIKDYGVEDYVAINLGLINNMNYYTGIIFQGFVDRIGQPVLMGGRYDHLGKQLDSVMPAIGFAFEVDLLIQAILEQRLAKAPKALVDTVIYYTKEKQREALTAAFELRNKGYQVLSFRNDPSNRNPISSNSIIRFEKEQNLFSNEQIKQTFSKADELVTLLQAHKEGF
ncbi:MULTISPECIES: ATP phosphoribosyltransferase regulatory subunit [Oceanobacillus]|uniref:ATP phosphoribosyltransferase regulatory subunit n=1 Tax=Oceanobacillus profundus TaxID=372463 RepID=A0A417YEE7_9BACI|nr:ATP phosphoribosyltransferase regulatory subunit [Oceanobacillus profundus]MBR3118460.1 ATP phosphoribosyltransferase regulatory subunit [Oceanobacillus sp.]MCM3398991.1 ATP phosphoribosyltransferase regulatory subunit [Oceanobacillus profundus]PAE28495.1 ATP phosphoribosyltransferase regulatory subunit [Paenibacillus sp. 7884-2]RHW31036.1 ATP phosphoribosyltransferase regulatory subunit [Oceanobacillus profundus]